MDILKINHEADIPKQWDLLFRCYDVDENSKDISNNYVAQLWSNVEFEDNIMEDGTVLDRCVQGKAEHLQGIKSFWHRTLRFLQPYKKEQIKVVFLNEFNDYPGMPYKDWMNRMYEESLKDCTYDKPVSRL